MSLGISVAFLLCLLVALVNAILQPIKAPQNIEELNRFVSYYLDPSDSLILNGSPQEFKSYLNNLTTGAIKTDQFDTWDVQTREKYLDFLHKSRTVAGRSDALYFGRFIEKLSTGQCTNTLFLGGSLTCGHRLEREHDGEVAFPELFEELINQVFPCFENSSVEMDIDRNTPNTPLYKLERHSFQNSTSNQQGRHKILNHCHSATGSSYAAIHFENLVCDAVSVVDLVIMEFASNDLKDNVAANGLKNSLEQAAPKYIEYLIRRFDSLSIPQLFLSASFRVAKFDVPTAVMQTAEDLHLLVQEHYDIPTVSWAKPMQEKFLEAWNNSTYKFYWQNIFFDIWSHQTAAGHNIITFLLLWNIQNDVQYWTTWPFKVIDRVPIDQFPHFSIDSTYWIFLKGTQRADYDYSQPVFQRYDGIEMSDDWDFTDEGRMKFGLVSSSPGSNISINIDGDEKLSVVSIGFLRSYASMGKFRVAFFSRTSSNDSTVCKLGGDDVSLHLLNCSIFEIDCLWKSHTSQTVPVMIKIPEGSEQMIIEVLNNSFPFDSNGSGGNKVKITSIAFFADKQSTCVSEPWLGPAFHNSTYVLETEEPELTAIELDTLWAREPFAGPWIAISSLSFVVGALTFRISRSKLRSDPISPPQI
jgi:hypothetical protein